MNNKPIILKRGKGKPTIVLIGSIHGDEPVGKRVIEAIGEYEILKGTLITIIGNPLALKKKKRYIDDDLNRCFPGKRRGSHEERLAYQIKRIISRADYCIDIHSTTTNTRYATIVKKTNKGIRTLLSLFSPKHVVIMPSGIGDGSLINFCTAGISLEYGQHYNEKTYKESLEEVIIILNNLGIIKTKIKQKKTKTQFFKIYQTEIKPKSFKMKKTLQNFTYIKKGELLGKVGNEKIVSKEGFYPVLFGPHSYEDIMGFKAKRIEKLQ